MESAHKYEAVDGQIIDLVTGEILPSDPLTGELLLPEQVVVEDLPKIGRWIASVDRKLDHLSDAVAGCHCEYCNLTRERDRLTAIATAKAEKLCQQRQAFMIVCENMVKMTGEKAIKYPGIGKFGWRKGLERVDDTAFQALTGGAQMQVQVDHPSLFRIKVDVDKTKVKAALKADPDLTVPFSLERGEDKFEFKAEA